MIEYVQMKSEDQALMEIIKDCATHRKITCFVLLRSPRDLSRCMYQVSELAKTLPTVEDVMGRRIRFTLTDSRIMFYTEGDINQHARTDGNDSKFVGAEFFSGVDFHGAAATFSDRIRRAPGLGDPKVFI